MRKTMAALFMSFPFSLHASCLDELRQTHRFLSPLTQLEGHFYAAKSLDQLRASLVDKELDLRGQLFRVEGLARAFEKPFPKPFQKMRYRWKSIEDALGRYGETLEAIEMATREKAPARILNRLKDREKKARKVFYEFLQKKNWHPKKAARKKFEKESKRLRKVKVLSALEDKALVLEYFIAKLKALEALDFDMHELEEGIHEMRRAIRWILIEIQALQGLIQLTNDHTGLEVTKYIHLESSPLAQKSYNKIVPNPYVLVPLWIPTSYFLAFSETVDRVGAIKSFGEGMTDLVAAYQEDGLSLEAAKQAAFDLVSKNRTPIDTFAEAEKVRTEFRDSGVIGALRRVFEAQLEIINKQLE